MPAAFFKRLLLLFCSLEKIQIDVCLWKSGLILHQVDGSLFPVVLAAIPEPNTRVCLG